ncbi:hypothetical protein MXD61_15860 [Frankia sp. AgPm24]|uniref:hypothetical protein n=1 Tax=Frankia sp. AgPm24 TaxID=631128 RepID=UPI00200EBE40|nr:hypothetical protein [Frankia sp. AgPm24]MCK9923328.1 hypothetical protein [Frankia sp. AgPm24]
MLLRDVDLLISTGVEPDYRITRADDADPDLRGAHLYWQQRIAAAPIVDTAAACGAWLAAHVDPEHQQAVAEDWLVEFAGITHETYDVIQTPQEITTATTRLLTQHAHAALGFAAAYHGMKLRHHCRWGTLDQYLTSSPLVTAAGAVHIPLYGSLGVAAAFGSDTTPSDRALVVFIAAWRDRGRSRHRADICLASLRTAMPFDGQAETLYACAAEAVADHPGDHRLLYLLAIGQRRVRDFTGALATIDRALQHAVDDERLIFRNRYLTYREQIDAASRLATLTTHDEPPPTTQDLPRWVEHPAVLTIPACLALLAGVTFALIAARTATISGTFGMRRDILLLLGTGLLTTAIATVTGLEILGRRWRHTPG